MPGKEKKKLTLVRAYQDLHGFLCLFRSVAETPSVRKANLYEFPFGFNYGWMLLIFALTSAYAVVCPLITPFGLFYMVRRDK